MNVPSTIDLTQVTKLKRSVSNVLQIPEIRVWCHPHKIGKSGDDYYYTFTTFPVALEFIKTNKEAEDTPLVAFRGYELNLWGIKEIKQPEKTKLGKTNMTPAAERMSPSNKAMGKALKDNGINLKSKT